MVRLQDRRLLGGVLAAILAAWIILLTNRSSDLDISTAEQVEGSPTRVTPTSSGGGVVTGDKVDKTFALPFLGDVEAADVVRKEVSLKGPDDQVLVFEVSIFEDKSGEWFRAEYSKEGKAFTPLPVKQLERVYNEGFQRIESLSKNEFPISIEEALARVSTYINLSKASHFSLTRVNMVTNDEGEVPQPFLIAEVFGARFAEGERRMDDVFKRVRLLFDLTRNWVMEDNVL